MGRMFIFFSVPITRRSSRMGWRSKATVGISGFLRMRSMCMTIPPKCPRLISPSFPSNPRPTKNCRASSRQSPNPTRCCSRCKTASATKPPWHENRRTRKRPRRRRVCLHQPHGSGTIDHSRIWPHQDCPTACRARRMRGSLRRLPPGFLMAAGPVRDSAGLLQGRWEKLLWNIPFNG